MIKTLNVILGVLVLIGTLSSTAMAEECFWRSSARSFHSEGRNAVVVEAGRKDYLVKTFPCFELPFAQAIDFRVWGGGSRVCRGDDLLVVDQFSGRILDRCRIQSIELVEE